MVEPIGTFDSILVVPYDQLLDRLVKGGAAHRGGPVWPDWDAQVAARWHRDARPQDVRPEPVPPVHRSDVAGAFWAGPVQDHFGHGVIEFSTRILGSLAADPEAVLVFSSRAERPVSTLADCPAWFVQMLDWYEVRAQRLHFVAAPTLFDRLSVVPQAEQLGVGPSAEHLDRLDALITRKPPPAARVPLLYVSRAAQRGRFAGEAYLEERLAAAGVRVIRPETASLEDQLQLYRAAEAMVFAEGSAIYALALLGRGLGGVDVICRRSGLRMGAAQLADRAWRAGWHDFVREELTFRTPAGVPGRAVGISVLDGDGLLALFEARGVPLSRHWDEAAWRRAVEGDVAAWLDAAYRPQSLIDAGSHGEIVATLEAVGCGALAGRAEALFASAVR